MCHQHTKSCFYISVIQAFEDGPMTNQNMWYCEIKR